MCSLGHQYTDGFLKNEKFFVELKMVSFAINKNYIRNLTTFFG